MGADRVVKTDVGARRIRWVEKFRKAVRAGDSDLKKENGPKMPAVSYSAAVTFRQIIELRCIFVLILTTGNVN